MTGVLNLLVVTLGQVWHTFSTNWPFLAVSAVLAALLKVYVDQAKVSTFLKRYRSGSVLAATGAAVGTPLCSCGTTAVVLGMMAGSMPWAPIVAFMAASPLTSPQELIYSAGLFGWPFAITFFVASIAVGLLGGLLAYLLESAGWLCCQARFRPVLAGATPVTAQTPRGVRVVLREALSAGQRLLVYFLAFAFIGYLLNNLIPAAWVSALFGSGRVYSVPLAATLGVPLYFNTEASLPLVRAMLDAGMSQGAALAFLVTGAGTSVGAIAGALTIARWRVVGLVILTLWIGAVVTGFAFDALLTVGAF